MPSKPPLLCIMGTTATGKTAVAMALAAQFDCHLISVDSALVYRGMDIGTAKPSAEELAAAPHALIDIRDPEQPYSAAQFADDARREIDVAHASNRLPVLVGGTNLYFRALLEGLSELPQANAALRDELSAQAQQLGWPALHARLAERDPETAARLHPNDGQRIQRALEVALVSGEPHSAHLARQQGNSVPWAVQKLGLNLPVETLNTRIAQRFEAMLAAGFVDEVAHLKARPALTADHPSMRAVGYRQLWAHLDGHYSLAEAAERGVIATRQFAKRQRTWLRKEADVDWHDVTSGQGAALQAAIKWCSAQF
ncbi:tRNA (adenosine(37)-N6)-dimethylallyltransferase MiaA [bacterium]|nr:tRNA (adenosine(37)-N6)-dimethylallyltransferase MiaA [bacterium]